MQIDFTVPVIDNFGDVGFALTLALGLLKQNGKLRINFYSQDESLFKKMLGVDDLRISYRSLEDYEAAEKSVVRCNFFAYPIREHEGVRLVLNFDYFQIHSHGGTFDPGIASLHETVSHIGKTKVFHIVPSPLAEWGWLAIPKNAMDSTMEVYDLAVFCYAPSRTAVEKALKGSEIKAISFGNEISGIKEVVPFLPISQFTDVLNQSRKLIVRGENSLAIAMALGKPFLWDIYREKNGAHIEKTMDFCKFLKPFLDAEWIEQIRIFATSEDGWERMAAIQKFLSKSDGIEGFKRLSETIRQHSLTEYVTNFLSEFEKNDNSVEIG